MSDSQSEKPARILPLSRASADESASGEPKVMSATQLLSRASADESASGEPKVMSATQLLDALLAFRDPLNALKAKAAANATASGDATQSAPAPLMVSSLAALAGTASTAKPALSMRREGAADSTLQTPPEPRDGTGTEKPKAIVTAFPGRPVRRPPDE